MVIPRFKFYLKDAVKWGEQEIIKFRWLLIFVVILFIGYRYATGMKEWAVMAMAFSMIFIFYNYLLDIIIKKFNSLVWISYFSTTVDIFILSGYIYFYAANYNHTAIATSSTVLLYPVLILFSVLRYERHLVIYSTVTIILAYNFIYFIIRPSIPEVILNSVASIGWDGQMFRSSYLALMGYFMFSIPKMVERLVDNQVSIIKEHNKRELKLALEAQLVKSQLDKERALNDKLNEQSKLIKEQKEKLEAANKTKNRLFSIVGHDLRSPFSVQCSLTELLAADYDNMSKEEILEIVNAINKSAQQGIGLLSNLLDWATISNGENIAQPPVVINTIVHETAALFYTQAMYKEIVIETSIPDDLQLCVNRNMLETVLRNLLSNAVKFSPRNSKIYVNAGRKDSCLFISVKDLGVGMTKEQKDCLFKLGMSSSPGTEDESGAGVGLVLCKELLEKNNGSIEVKSEPGKGAEFIINLPEFPNVTAS